MVDAHCSVSGLRRDRLAAPSGRGPIVQARSATTRSTAINSSCSASLRLVPDEHSGGAAAGSGDKRRPVPRLQLSEAGHRVHRLVEADAGSLTVLCGGAERGAGSVQRRQHAGLALARRPLAVARGGPPAGRS